MEHVLSEFIKDTFMDIDEDSFSVEDGQAQVILETEAFNEISLQVAGKAFLYNAIKSSSNNKLELDLRRYVKGNWVKVQVLVERTDRGTVVTAVLKGYEAMSSTGNLIYVDSLRAKNRLG